MHILIVSIFCTHTDTTHMYVKAIKMQMQVFMSTCVFISPGKAYGRAITGLLADVHLNFKEISREFSK